jgi:nicotinamidase-related amidase
MSNSAPWNRFLTESDKARNAAQKKGPLGFGERPALLFIDLYRAVFGDKREPLMEGLKRFPSHCGETAWDSIPHLQRLLTAARETGIPVIHSTGLEGIPAWRRPRQGEAPRKESDEEAKRKYEIVPEVAPVDGEVVLRKASPSVFWGTPLAGYLTQLGVDTILVGGESTSGCVRATVVDGCTNRYRMMVVEECVFDRDEACHAINLYDMDQKYGEVTSLDDTLEWLYDWKATHEGWPAYRV